MQFIGIIPARYESTRFPGKPLAVLGEKTIIQHVYEKASQSLPFVWVATDDDRIARHVETFGGRVVMTRNDHASGTDRCAEAALKISAEMRFDVVINIQGDEPFVQAEHIEGLQHCFADPSADLATLVKQIDSLEVLFNPNRPKVVVDTQWNALLFSRSAIPYLRGEDAANWVQKHPYYSHLGMYAYKADILQQISKLAPSALEKAESLEQLRWLENGFRIKVAETSFESIGIDTPADLEAAKALLG